MVAQIKNLEHSIQQMQAANMPFTLAQLKRDLYIIDENMAKKLANLPVYFRNLKVRFPSFNIQDYADHLPVLRANFTQLPIEVKKMFFENFSKIEEDTSIVVKSYFDGNINLYELIQLDRLLSKTERDCIGKTVRELVSYGVLPSSFYDLSYYGFFENYVESISISRIYYIVFKTGTNRKSKIFLKIDALIGWGCRGILSLDDIHVLIDKTYEIRKLISKDTAIKERSYVLGKLRESFSQSISISLEKSGADNLEAITFAKINNQEKVTFTTDEMLYLLALIKYAS